MALFNERLIANRELITTRGADITTAGTITDLVNSGFSYVRLTACTQLSSVTADVDGKELTIVNANTVPLTLKNETGTTAANRVLTGTGNDVSVAPGATALLKYDGAASRWRVFGALPYEGGRVVLWGYLTPATSCVYSVANATINGFPNNGVCLGPTWAYNPISIGRTNNTTNVAFEVQNVPVGVYEVSFNFATQMTPIDDACFAIGFFNVDTSATINSFVTAPSIITNTLTNNLTVTGVFSLGVAMALGRFTLLVQSSGTAVVSVYNDNAKRPITLKVVRYPV